MLEAIKRGAADDVEASIMTGTYHNGPLTVLLPFGIWGCIGFAWFIIAGLRALYRFYRHSPDELRGINTLLFSFFIMKIVFYLTIFGHFAEDLGVFCGILGLSCTLNAGARREQATKPEPVSETSAVPALAV